jgi:hypothetical protein
MMTHGKREHGFTDHAGQTVIGKTCYDVYRLPANVDCGIVARFGLVGPRGSTYLVTDLGDGYRLNSVCLGGGVSWAAAPRPLRGLERKHLSLFYAVDTTKTQAITAAVIG